MRPPSPSNRKPASSAERSRWRAHASGARQAGLSLIELMIFVVVVGIAIAGLLIVYDRTVRSSADPLVRKQAVAIAESLLAEVLAQPYTYCDPQDVKNDPDAPPASTADCTLNAAGSQDKGGGALGPQPATERRFLDTDPFDNVADYNGYQMPGGIYSLDDGSAPIPGLDAYSASITVTRTGVLFGLPDDAALRVDVLVTGKGESITLTGYRLRHSPNATG
jgi:MSHA pilin protein MshD